MFGTLILRDVPHLELDGGSGCKGYSHECYEGVDEDVNSKSNEKVFLVKSYFTKYLYDNV